MRKFEVAIGFIAALGAIACILQWLEIRPRDFAMLSLPHWLWLFAAILLMAVSLASSIRAYIVSSHLVPQLERKVAEEMSAKEKREGELDELRVHFDDLKNKLEERRV